MKAVKEFITAVLIIAIFAGIGYIGWSLFMTPGGNLAAAKIFSFIKPKQENTEVQKQTNETLTKESEKTTGHGSGMADMTGMENGNTSEVTTAKSNVPDIQYTINNTSMKNSERLTQALSIFNQAFDQITVDPYVTATIITPKQNTQGAQSPQTVTINPSGSTTVNLQGGTQTQQTIQEQQGTNYVFDQSKLQQLNNAIFTLSQGIEELNRLNEEFTNQAAKVEKNPADYETYLTRYYTYYSNKTRLTNALNMLNQAGTIINVNPYASADGYKIDVNVMKKVHEGVFKLAKANALLMRLNEELTLQINDSYVKIQEFADASNRAAVDAANKVALAEQQKQQLEYAKTMEEYQKNQQKLLEEQQKAAAGQQSKQNASLIIYAIIILFVVGLVAGVIGAIISMLFPKKDKTKETISIDKEGGTIEQ